MLKKLTIGLIFSLLFSSCSNKVNIPDNIPQKTPVKIEKNLSKENKQEVSNLKNVGVEEFKKEIEKGNSILIDLRTPEELKQGIIPGVKLNLDYYSKDFINKLKALDKNKKYLIYCHSGHRSGNTLLLMKKFGFKNVFNLENGIISWVNSGEKLGSFEEKNIKKFSLEEVKKHNKNSDCWTIIDGKVYDLTSFFGTHPGGDDNLAKLCGIDGTSLFNNKHGNNTKAQIKKKDFYIGDLEK